MGSEGSSAFGSAGLPSPFAEEVLDLVATIPPGYAMSYGDIARVLGSGGPRQVAQTMSRFGSGVPWWRVVRADGTPAVPVAVQAWALLRSDGIPMTSSGHRIDWARARWSPEPSSEPSSEPADMSGVDGVMGA